MDKEGRGPRQGIALSVVELECRGIGTVRNIDLRPFSALLMDSSPSSTPERKILDEGRE